MCSQTAIVFTRYMFLSVATREQKDDRSIGPLFYEVCDEIADISFDTALEKLQLFLDNLAEQIKSSKVGLYSMINEFLSILPKYMANNLVFKGSA